MSPRPPKARRSALSTVTQISAARAAEGAKQTEFAIAKVGGLSLRVSADGRKSWTLRYRAADGTQRRLALGTFPSVGLKDAQQAALAALGDIHRGKDPAEDKRVSRAAAAASRPVTVAELIAAYLTDAERGRHRPNARPKRAGTLGLDRYYTDRHIGPKLGGVPIAELTRHQVQAFLDDVGADAPSTARHCRAVIRQAFNYAVRRELVTGNPAQLADLPLATQRERVLSDAELASVWEASGRLDLGVTRSIGLAMRLAMLTLQRGGEVIGIHASEIDRAARLWTIPGHRTKNHRTHTVPLSAAALDVLAEAFAIADPKATEWSGFAFPGRLDPKTREARPAARPSLSRASKRLTRAIGIDDVTPHDFRRTGSTRITGEAIGIPRFIVSRVLNQISDTGGAAAVTAVYDRNAYLPEKRRALDAWAALLAEIVSGEARPSNVVKISI